MDYRPRLCFQISCFWLSPEIKHHSFLFSMFTVDDRSVLLLVKISERDIEAVGGVGTLSRWHGLVWQCENCNAYTDISLTKMKMRLRILEMLFKTSSSAMNPKSVDLPTIPNSPQALIKKLWTFYILWAHTPYAALQAQVLTSTPGAATREETQLYIQQLAVIIKVMMKKEREAF